MVNWTSALLWMLILFFQNISFTYVSRARSSGRNHATPESFNFSNGIWILSQMVMLGPLFDYITGRHGRTLQIEAGILYTVACVSGSLFAHWLAMKTEKGKNAVGHNKLYAQVPVEDWKGVMEMLDDYRDLQKKIVEAGREETNAS